MSEDGRRRLVTIVVWLARIAVAGIFGVAAIGKIVDPAAFSEAVSNYRVFPHWSWNAIALVVPMVEAVGAIGLVTGWKRRGAALLLAALTLGFLILIGSALVRGLDVTCGCFGSDTTAPVDWFDFLADLGLLALILVAGGLPRRQSADSSHISRPSPNHGG